MVELFIYENLKFSGRKFKVRTLNLMGKNPDFSKTVEGDVFSWNQNCEIITVISTVEVSLKKPSSDRKSSIES